MKYRVYLDKLLSGTIEIYAERKELAEKAAMSAATTAVDWSDDPTISVCDVVALDEDDNEID